MAKTNIVKAITTPVKNKSGKVIPPGIPSSRKSQSDDTTNILGLQALTTVQPEFLRTIIPRVRRLAIYNEDVGQAIHNIVTLGNTGHQIFFDNSTPPGDVDKMRNYLQNRSDWATGQAGMDGIVNRMITQLLIGGAASAEWVPANDLSHIESVILVNPEEIEFKLDARHTRYMAYQRIKNAIPTPRTKEVDFSLIPLNPNTYKYLAMGGDGETPYGIPPYIPALSRVCSQSKMDTNINYVVDQMGLMGFIEALIQKPDEEEGTDTAYEEKLDNLLVQAKNRIANGFKDGIVVGFNGDHEFNFHSASKTYGDAVELYKNNELMIASALKQDASMWGRAYATSETQITVVFIKMLSELKNIHTTISRMLEFGYNLELRLAGFKFNSLSVKFNRSTIQDEYKYQQAEEIKIRNVKDKLILGMINQDKAADELGYETPASPQPRVSWSVLAGAAAPPKEGPLEADKAKSKADTKKKKTASDTKKRREAKILPTK